MDVLFCLFVGGLFVGFSLFLHFLQKLDKGTIKDMMCVSFVVGVVLWVVVLAFGLVELLYFFFEK